MVDFVKKEWQFRDVISENELNRMEDGIEEGITKAEQAQGDISAHVARADNPHGVTKDQVGLGNVDNVKQASKAEFDAHVAETETWQRYKLTGDDGLGKGGFYAGDLNDLVDTGIYSVTEATNRPVEAIGICIVIRRSTSHLQQMYATTTASASNRDRVFSRTSIDNGETWSDWLELINSNGGTMTGSLFIDGGALYRSFAVRREVSGVTYTSDLSVNASGEAQVVRFVDGSINGAFRVEGAGRYNFDGTKFYIGSGSPEGVVVAPVGSLYLRTDGGTSTTLYVKTSGTGNTGWTAK